MLLSLPAVGVLASVPAGAQVEPENVIETPLVPLELPVEIETEVGPAASLKQAPLWKEIEELLENPYEQRCEPSPLFASGVDCVALEDDRRPSFTDEDLPPLKVFPLGFNKVTGQPLRIRLTDGEMSWDQPGPLFAEGDFADPLDRPIIGHLIVVDDTLDVFPDNPGGFTAEDCPALAMHDELGPYGGGCLAVYNATNDPQIPPNWTIVAVPAFYPEIDGGPPVLHELDELTGELEVVVELEAPVTESNFLRAADDTRGLGGLRGLPTGREAAEILGKALFWDMQVGSDGVQACGSCHFHAGVDNRTKNQLNPGHLGGDLELEVKGPNEEVVASDFPFHGLTDPGVPGEPNFNPANVFSDSNDVLSSMGVRFRKFVDVPVGDDAFGPSVEGVKPLLPDIASEIPEDNIDPIGVFDGLRRVEPRNTPTMHAAAFNFDNFWDARARFHFNGGSVFGPSDPFAHVYVEDEEGELAEMTHPAEADEPISEWTGGESPVRIKIASLGSQAVGPPLSNFEMSFDGRNLAKIGKKLLQGGVTPLANQLVSPDDSELGMFSNQGGSACRRTQIGRPGLCITYKKLIKMAFPPELWGFEDGHLVGTPAVCTGTDDNGFPTPAGCDPFDGYVLSIADSAEPADPLDTNQFLQIEANFALFFGLAVQIWEQLLIPDDTPFDRFLDANPRAGFGVGQPGEQGTLPPRDLRILVLDDPNDPNDDPLDPSAGLEMVDGFGPDELWGFDIFAGANLTAALPIEPGTRNPEGFGSNPFLRTGRCMLCHLGPEQSDHTVNVAHGILGSDTEYELPPPSAPEPTGPPRFMTGLILSEEFEEGAQDAIEVENRNMAIHPDSLGPFANGYDEALVSGEYAARLALPNGTAFQDNGIYNIGLRPTDEDIGRGGPDPFGWPLSLAQLAFINLEGVVDGRYYQPCDDPDDWLNHPTGCALTRFDPAEGFGGGLFEETGGGGFYPGTTHTLQSVNPGLEMEPANPQLPEYMVDWVNNLPAGENHPQTDELASTPNTITHVPFAEFGEIQFGSDFNCIFVPGSGNFWGERCPNVQSAVPGNFDPNLNGTWPFPNRTAASGAFKAPPLRNVELTGPYFHTGSYLTLRQVVDFYVRGGDFPISNLQNRDPNIVDLREQVFGFGSTTALEVLLDAGVIIDGVPDTFARYDAMPDLAHAETPEPMTSTPEDAAKALVKFLLSLTDPRVPHQRAPFDRPEIFVPIDGAAGDNTGGRPALIADAHFLHLPAVGAEGTDTPLSNFLGVASEETDGVCDHFDPAGSADCGTPAVVAAPEVPIDQGFHVAVGLDPQLTQPLHLGQRFVAKKRHRTAKQKGEKLVLDIKAEKGGQPIDATFTPASDNVQVSNGRGRKTTVTVLGCGELAAVRVSSAEGSRSLRIRTTCRGNAIEGVVTQ